MRSLLHQKRIIVLCGIGGVGKTTLSAALALMGAMEGKRSLALTVDPARRLAQAMGLGDLKDRVRLIPSSFFARAGLTPAGSLSAVMLDTRRTFDRIIEQTAPSPEISARILSNPIYDHMAGFMAGSHEYMAMEKLLEFHHSGQYDLMVLDTPPARHALNFLDAPKRMLDFLDDSVFRWFIKPTIALSRLPIKILEKGTEFHLGLLERFTGIQVLGDLADFFGNFSGMYQGFKERAAQVRDLLGSDCAAFVLVAAPNQTAIWENRFFCRRLLEENMPLAYVVFNRVRMLERDQEALQDNPGVEELRQLLGHAETQNGLDTADLQRLLEKLRDNFRQYRRLVEMDFAAMEAFQKQLPPHLPTVCVPLMGENVHNLRALHRLGQYLANERADRYVNQLN
jgi:anion-transporting  ArsA/GET3 family ATPase